MTHVGELVQNLPELYDVDCRVHRQYRPIYRCKLPAPLKRFNFAVGKDKYQSRGGAQIHEFAIRGTISGRMNLSYVPEIVRCINHVPMATGTPEIQIEPFYNSYYNDPEVDLHLRWREQVGRSMIQFGGEVLSGFPDDTDEKLYKTVIFMIADAEKTLNAAYEVFVAHGFKVPDMTIKPLERPSKAAMTDEEATKVEAQPS